MRAFKFSLCLALCVSAHAVTVFRVDPSPVMTTAGNAPVGGYPALYAVASATIQVCTDAACATPATTYTDATGNTTCPTTAQVVLAGTTLCTAATGPQGQFGFWVAPGTYYYRVTFPSGQSFGNFPVTGNTAGVTSNIAGAGISLSGATGAVTITNTGALSFNGRTGAISPTSGDYTFSQIGGAKQGNTSVPQMAGTNSGVTGAPLCDDAAGNTTTSGCASTLPAGTQGQQLQLQTNTTSATYQFLSPAQINALNYNFPAYTCTNANACAAGGPTGGTLTASVQAVETLTPCPFGMSGATAPTYISGGSGAAEAVSTVFSVGSSSCTATFTPANNHSGSFNIADVGGGIQSAICSLVAGGDVVVPAGTFALNGALTFCGRSSVRVLLSSGFAISGSGSLPTPNGTNLIWYPGVNSTGRAGWVTVYPSPTQNGAGVAIAPDGHIICSPTVGSTTTACLQEAEDYAWNHGMNLRVTGGQEPTPCNGCIGPTGAAVVYQFAANAQWHIRPSQGGYTTIEQASIIGANTSPLIWFDSGVMVHFMMYGSQVVNTGGCFLFNPTNSITDAGFTFIVTGSSVYSLGACTESAGAYSAVEFVTTNANSGGISGNQFSFTELNEAGATAPAIKVDNPPGVQTFTWNTIHSGSIHGQAGANSVVQIGTSGAGTPLIAQNTWELNIVGDTATGHGVDNWGGLSKFTVTDAGGTHDYAFYDESGACQNTVTAMLLAGISQIANGQSLGGAGMNCTQVIGGPTPGAYNVTLTSTVQYTNLDGQFETIMVVAGNTATVIQICSNGGACYTTGQTTGAFGLKPGAGIKVTFSGSTTFGKIL